MIDEMEAFSAVLKKYNVKVYRPEMIENYKIFSRDIGFVIDDIFIKSNILPDRERELDAIQYKQLIQKKWFVHQRRFI
jgi:N-dimethylarginine dimethylaminohydrolase